MRKIALRSFWAHKLRMVLTVVAIVLSVSFITGTLVLGDTLNRVFDDLFADVNEEVDAQVQGEELFSDGFGTTARAPLAAALVDDVAGVDGVTDAAGFVVTTGFGNLNVLLDDEGEPLGSANGPPTLLENWVEADPLNPYTLVGDGRAPEADDELALNLAAADDGGLEVGDTVTVLTQFGRQEYELVGTFTFGEAGSVGGAVSADFTLAEAQRLAGLEDQVHGINVVGDEGLSEREVADRVAAVVPAGVEVLTGEEASEQLADDVSQGFGFFQQILLVFGILSVVVGAFIIANTFSILVAQRTRELALLRAVGASRRQVLVSVLLEGAVVGVISAVLGLGGGVLLATAVIGAFEASGSDLPTTNLQVGTGPLIWALCVGVGVTLLAAIIPAVRATRVPPLAALREVAIDRSGASKGRVILGVLTLLLSLLMMSAAWTADGDTDAIPGVAMGVVLALATCVILGPVFADASVRVLGAGVARLRGVTGRLAVENAARSPKRTSATASALLVSVALVGFITVFADSAKTSITAEIERGFTGDFVVQGSFGFGPPPSYPESVVDEIAGVDGVTLVSPVGFINAQFAYENGEDATNFLTTTEPETLGQVLSPRMAEGEFTDLTDEGILVDTQIAEDNDIQIGDTVTVTGPNGGQVDLEVQALSDDQAILGAFAVTREVERSLTDQLVVLQTFGDIDDGRDVDAVFDEIAAAVSSTPDLDVFTPEEFAGSLADQINSFLTFIYALLALSVIISVIGVINTLLLSIIERTREFGLLRAVGMSRSQLKSSVRWEALLISVLGTLVGLVAGLVLSYVLIQSLEGFGLKEFSVPGGSLAFIVVIAVLLGLLASLYPARRASRLKILDAIATE